MKSMTKLLTVCILSLLSITWNAWAQGEICFTNYAPGDDLNAPVFNIDGTRLEGDRFMARLLGGRSADTLEPVGEAVPFRIDGFFLGGSRIVPGALELHEVTVKVLAWDTQTGSSFEEATIKGMSTVFTVEPALSATRPVPPLTGLESFSLVPEPSPWLLALIGLGIIGLRRNLRLKTVRV